MMNIVNAIKNYFDKYGIEIASMGAMMTGDIAGALAMKELEKRMVR